ncbi:DUF4131 domain-containing protein [Cohnella sp. CFH 77786]|uniref:ComEC/Rec2 family competence protein n=1 Tax=Cohnella sp. CFH 77786 TaxID=2662265 RepID=UPI001C60B654|nr:ComEC/Rec2 family competence protein [Cohnella sp. CFH 77786]MBW5444955.1 DUF4131 domain-containing protein [Cohnella sp. CFH 77786]
MNERPLVAFACCWLAGASVPSLWPGTGQLTAYAALVLVLTGCWLTGGLTGRLACVCLAALLLASAERAWVDKTGESDLSARWRTGSVPVRAVAEGTIVSPPEADGDIVTFRLSADRLREDSSGEFPIRETVLVRVKLKEQAEQAAASAWKRGDRIRAAGIPEKPADAGNFGAFDYRIYLERQGIRWQWSVRGAESVEPVKAAVPPHLLPLRAMDDLRAAIGRLMDGLYPNGDAGYMKGLVAGISDEVDPGQYDAFSRLGLTHVLAISGLHVGVVVFVILRFGALCRLTRERTIDIAFAAMPFYMLVTGASPSAVRACLMAMIALVLAKRHRLKDGLHLLAAAALAMVIWDPHVVENVSFQLSFAVTAGLLLFTPFAAGALRGVRPRFLREALAVGITAQTVSFPLTVYYFHGVHLLSLPANLILVPFISFAVLPLGMASVALGAAWAPLGAIPAMLASAGNRLTFWIVEFLNRAETLRTVWPQPSRLWVVCAYVLIGGTVWLLRRKAALKRAETETGAIGLETDATLPLAESHAAPSRSLLRAAAVRASLVFVWGGWLLWGYRPAFLDADAYVQFLDVGQGDAALIRTGSGKHVLVDAGGTVVFRKPGDEWRERRDPYEIGRKLLVPLLRQRGVRALDALVITHLDADHMGGAEAVLKSVPVGAVIWNGTWKRSPGADRLFREAERRGIPVYAAKSGMKWKPDNSSEIEVLFPDPETDRGGSVPPAELPAPLPVLDKQNESSVVLMLTVYGRRFLLTGDVETRGETDIVREAREAGMLRRRDTHVDVMKAAHHGSKTSTSPDWLAWWKPSEAVISVGRRNPYGHPHPAVVARLAGAGLTVLRTDRDGEVRYRVTPRGALWRQTKRPSGETVAP